MVFVTGGKHSGKFLRRNHSPHMDVGDCDLGHRKVGTSPTEVTGSGTEVFELGT